MDREPFSLQDSWAQAGELYAWIVSLFGAPFAIAARLIILRENRRKILEWLAPVEALARRLLLLKALTMAKSNAPATRGASGRLLTAFTDRAEADIDPDSANWRVRFCVLPHGAVRRKTPGEICIDQRGGGVILNALPLARRLEALRRVLENPGPALARLSRLLAAQRETVVAAFRPYRPPALPVQALLPAAQREVELALNSS